ncbi:MAG: YpmS family protein [Lactobacillales bacterium]|nr:YpmS family protein [Lactobacillales bacterium]
MRNEETPRRSAETNKQPKTSPTTSHKLNIWKIGFFVLLAIIIGILFTGLKMAMTVREPNLPTVESTQAKGEKITTLTSNKEQVNSLINETLKGYQDKKSTYKFYLDKQAVLEGTYTFLGSKVPLYIYFEPYKMEDGNIQLKVNSISVGTLGLPTNTILSFVKNSYKFPSFVEIQSSKDQIVIRLDELKFDNKFFVKANRIDLINDKISFDLFSTK